MGRPVTAMFCNQTALMHHASGMIPGTLGSYSSCPADEGVQYCILFPTEPKWGNSRILGYCLPTACTLLEIARHVVSDPVLNDTFRYSDLIDDVNPNASLPQYVVCAPRSPAPLQVSSENIASWTILGLILVLVLLATLYDYCWKITSRSIPFEVVAMGNDGTAVWTLQSPNVVPVGFKGGGGGGGSSSADPVFEGEKSHHALRYQLHVDPRISCVSHPDASSFRPLLASENRSAAPEGIGIGDGSGGRERQPSAPHFKVAADDAMTSQKCAMRRGFIFKHKGFSVDAVAEEGVSSSSAALLRHGGDTEGARSGRILPDLNTNVFWTNKRVQQFLAEMPEAPDFNLMVNRAVLCLSLINSFRKWRYYPELEANLNVFNSWRVLTWVWIMLFSVFWYSQQIPTLENVGSRRGDPLYAFLEKEAFASFAVSTFLIIAGFHALHRLHTSEEVRMASPTLRVRDSQRTCGQLALQYAAWYIRYLVARFVRIVPITFSILVLVPSSMPTNGEGPFWALFSKSPVLHMNCMKHWWANLLLVNNFLPVEKNERCFPWSYYVALEFQLVALAPFIYLLGKCLHHRVFSVLMMLVMAASATLRYIALTRQKTVSFAWNAVSHYSLPVDTVHQYPHLMLIPFCAGATLYYSYRGVRQRAETLRMFGQDIFGMMNSVQGAVLPEDRASYWLLEKLRVWRVRMLIMWSGLFIIFSCIMTTWVVHSDDHSGENIATGMRVFESLILFPWCFGVCLLVFPLLFGYGGMVRHFFVHRLWCGASRLVLAAYLLGPVVIGFGNSSSYEVITMGFTLMCVQWLGYVLVTLLLAFVFHMLIERPCLHVSSRGEY